MFKNLLEIEHYFVDATYHCIFPTIKKYKLFVISGFNIKDKKTYICLYALLPNVEFNTYDKLFSFLNNEFKFNRKIFTIDFCRSCTKAINKNYPQCLLIKCYFHWVKALWNNIKNLGFTDKTKMSKTKELICNIEFKAFLDPKILKKFYNKITFNYMMIMKIFLNISKRLCKYTSIFNYYEIIRGPEFDIKNVFLTNNIAEKKIFEFIIQKNLSII